MEDTTDQREKTIRSHKQKDILQQISDMYSKREKVRTFLSLFNFVERR